MMQHPTRKPRTGRQRPAKTVLCLLLSLMILLGSAPAAFAAEPESAAAAAEPGSSSVGSVEESTPPDGSSSAAGASSEVEAPSHPVSSLPPAEPQEEASSAAPAPSSEAPEAPPASAPASSEPAAEPAPEEEAPAEAPEAPKDEDEKKEEPEEEVPAAIAADEPVLASQAAGLAVFDGTDLAYDTAGKSYANTDLANNAKHLRVDAKFTANQSGLTVTGRTLTIELGMGLAFDTLPGFKWNTTSGTWEYNNSLLPHEKQSAVVAASFVPKQATLGGQLRTLKAGTVTYVMNDDNVTEITMEPTVKYDTVFMANGTGEKLLENAIQVTTTEKRNSNPPVQVGHETLETLKVSGAVGAYVYNTNTNIQYLAQNQGTTLDYTLLGYAHDFTYVAMWDDFYINKGSFVLNLPEGLELNPTDTSDLDTALEFYSNSDPQYDHSVFRPDNPGEPYRMRITKAEDKGASGTDVTFELNDVYLGPAEYYDNEYKAFRVRIKTKDVVIPDEKDRTRLTLTGKDFKITPYGGYTEGDAGKATDRYIDLRSKNDATVSISWLAATHAANGVGYVPKAEMDLDRNNSVLLGSYRLTNENSIPTGLQTVHIDFSANGTNGARARVLRLPVGTDGEVPNIKLKLASGKTPTISGYKKFFQSGDSNVSYSDYVVFDLAELSGAPHNVSATDYIEIIEYEIDKLPSSYRSSTGTGARIGYHYSSIYGYFEGFPASGLVQYEIGVAAGSIADNASITWATKQYATKVTTSNSAQFKIENVAGGQTFTAGESYTLEPLVRLPSYNLFMNNTQGPVTYIKGFDIYLRTLNKIDIDTDNMYLRQNWKGVAGLPAADYKIQPGDFTEYETDTGRVIKISLPQAVLNTVATSTHHAQERAYLQDTTFNLIYSFTVDPFAATSVHSTSELIWVQPNIASASYNPTVVITDSTIADYNMENMYNVDGSGNAGLRFGTLSEKLNFNFAPQSAFLASTAARQQVGSADSGWRTAANKNDALGITTFGDTSYRLLVDNTSGFVAERYVAHIPIPKAGDGASSGFPSDGTGGTAEFGWTAELKSPVAKPTVPAGATVTILYSEDYVPSVSSSSNFEEWNGSNAASYKTVRIVYEGAPMQNNTSHAYVLPLDVVGGTNGQTNFYSSKIGYSLKDSVSESDKTSQPVALRLCSGVIMGRVYKDSNRNGSFDGQDTGIAGVSVDSTIIGGPSFGGSPKPLATVFTDTNGYFTIPMAEHDVATLVITNPEYGSKKLRFYGENSAAQDKTLPSLTATASSNNVAGDIGLEPPYTIRFDDNLTSGGTVFSPVYRYAGETLAGSHEVSDAIPVPPPATSVVGYTFEGWYENPNKSGIQYSGSYDPASKGDITFFAVRSPNPVAVTFDANGGTDPQGVSMTIGTKTVADAITKAEADDRTPSRKGATFVGWSLSAANNPATSLSFPYSLLPHAAAGSVTLYAVWEANYTVEYVDIDLAPTHPEYGLRTTVQGHGRVGTAIPGTTPPPAIAGYVHKQTDNHGTGAVLAFTDSDDAQVVTLRYRRLFNVTFNPNGGSLPAGALASFQAERNSLLNAQHANVSRNTPPTRSGATFEYWTLGSAGARVDFAAGHTVTEDVEFVAQWEGFASYVVHHYLAGTTRKVAPDETGSAAVGTVINAKALTSLAAYKPSGATAQDITLVSDASRNVVTFYYKTRSYTVTFLDHDGTQLNKQTVAHGKAATAPAVPDHDGYRFVRWNKDFSNIRANLTVTAICEVIPVSVIPGTSESSSTVTTPRTPTPAAPVTSGASSTAGTAPAAPATASAAPASPASTAPAAPAGEAPAAEEPASAPQAAASEPEVSSGLLSGLVNGEVPLGGFGVHDAWSLLNLLISIVCILGSLVLFFWRVMKKGKDDREQRDWEDRQMESEHDLADEHEPAKKPFTALWALAVATGLVSIVLFLILENLHSPVTWVNRYTLLFIVLLVVDAIVVALQTALKRRDEEQRRGGTDSAQ